MTIAEALAKLGITDTLNRSEDPIGGEWKRLDPGVATGKALNTAGEEGYATTTLFSGGEDDAYWSKATFAGNVAAVLQITRIPVTSERQLGIWVCRDKTSPVATKSGYRLRAEWLSGKKIKFVLEKWVAGVMSELKKVETEAYGDNSRIAIVVSGGRVYFFASKEEASAFEQVLEVEDATYTEGYSGLWGKGRGEFSGKNFATGTLELEEKAGVLEPKAATVNLSVPTPEVVVALQPVAATVNVSVPTVEFAAGPALSSTESEHKGLPLPFPTIVPNPQRLGPPRFTALERKTLGLDR